MTQVVVTGGTKRIGLAISKGFVEAGYRVFAHRRADASVEASPSGPHDHPLLVFDFADPDASADLLARFLCEQPDTNVMVLNASMFVPDCVDAIDAENLTTSLRVNLETQIRLANAFKEHHRAVPMPGGARSVIIVLLDQKLYNPNPDFFSYTISKYAMAGLVELFGSAEDDCHVLTYGLAPGLTLPSHDQTAEEFFISSRMNLLTRQNRPEEIAQACLFLSRGLLRNGTILLSDSGQHLTAQRRDVMYEIRTQQCAMN